MCPVVFLAQIRRRREDRYGRIVECILRRATQLTDLVTLPKTNMKPENEPLEYDFSLITTDAVFRFHVDRFPSVLE